MKEKTNDSTERLEFLSGCPPFTSLPPLVLELVASRMTERRFKKGEKLIRQGEPGSELFVIRRGLAEVIVTDERGVRLTLAMPGQGEVVGEVSLLTEEPRNADVVAVEDLTAYALSADDFHKLVGRHPIMSVLLTDLAAKRLGSGEFDALRGKVLNGYRIRRCLGRGGMAVVYEAEALEKGTRVALKMLNHRLVYDPTVLGRFQREADIVASLRHENIAALYDRFSAYNTYFLVMEYCDGPTLAQVVERGKEIPEAEVRRIVGQLARALAYVHGRGIVHRDLKPSNVMVTRDGTVKLMDFGIARPDVQSDLTRQGMVIGTPRYMPPEQLGGKPVDEKADLYAFGCIAYALLAGDVPFEGDDLAAILYQKLTWRLPPPMEIRSDLAEDLYELLARTLAVEPKERVIDLEALSSWARPVSTEEIFPFSPHPDPGEDSTETVER